MKIWIDILTPKQLLFYKPMIEKLRKKHTVICTGRRYRELSNLARIHGMKLIYVDKHGGGKKESKLRASISRMGKLQVLIQKYRPDLLISSCSPDASRVAYGLNIKHIGFTDSPHTIAVMRLGVPLLDKLLIPSIIPKSEFTKFGISSKNIMTYNAIDAMLIVKQKIPKTKIPFSKDKKTILFRVYEDQAAYVKQNVKSDEIIKKLIRNVDAEIVIMPRYREQISYFTKKFGNKVKILTKQYNGKSLLINSDLFIGSGGTMTAESALLGVPTISYSILSNLIIEKYLASKKIAKRESDPDKISRLAQRMLSDKRSKYLKKSNEVIKQMQDPYEILNKAIREIQNNRKYH